MWEVKKNAKQLLIYTMNWTHSEWRARLWTPASKLVPSPLDMMYANVFWATQSWTSPRRICKCFRDRADQGESIDWLSHSNGRSRVSNFTAQNTKSTGAWMEWLTARIFLRSSTLKWFNSLGTLSVNLILRVIDAIKYQAYSQEWRKTGF